jgi:hypothetical protein
MSREHDAIPQHEPEDPYTPAEWAAIMAETGPVDELWSHLIRSQALLLRDAEEHSGEAAPPLARLGADLCRLADELSTDDVQMALAVADSDSEEIENLRALMVKYSEIVRRRAEWAAPRRPPRAAPIARRNFALVQFASIFEQLHPRCYPGWDDVSKTATGRLCRYLLACANPVLPEGKRLTMNAARSWYQQRYLGHDERALAIPWEVHEQEDIDTR